MPGPWEKYASPAETAPAEAAPAATGAGKPWEKYAAPAQAEEGSGEAYRGAVLPLSRDEEGNVRFDSDAGIFGMIKGALTLPGDAMAGKVDPLSDEGVRRSADLAAIATPAGTAARASGAMRSAAPPQVSRMPEAGTARSVAEAGERIGVDLPSAVVSDNRTIQQLGKTLQSVPGGGSPLRAASERAIGQLDDAAREVQGGYGSGSPALAGDAAREGIRTHITTTIGERIAKKYEAVDALVSPDVKAPLARTQEVASKIMARRQNAGIEQPSEAVRRIADAMERKDGLNYEGVKDLRTYIGELLETPSALPSDIRGSELKQIYSALTEDLRATVRKSGGNDALKAFDQANSYAAKMAKERESLNRFLGANNDEGLFDRIMATATSSSRADIKQLARARSAVSPETWNEVASATVARLGRGPDGNFSPDRFVTAYGKLSPEGKKVLFRSSGKDQLADALDDIAEVSTRFKSLQQYANPSGTGQTNATIAFLGGSVLNPLAALGGVLSARVTSEMLARPASARAMANWAKAYERAVTKPSTTSRNLLKSRSRVVGSTVATDLGVPQLSARIASELDAIVGARGEAEEEQPLPMAPEDEKKKKEDETGGVEPSRSGHAGSIPARRVDRQSNVRRLTPADRASPMPPDLIGQGKAMIEDATAR